jgi:hypothetical protein
MPQKKKTGAFHGERKKKKAGKGLNSAGSRYCPLEAPTV